MRLRTKYAVVLIVVLLVLGALVVVTGELFEQQMVDREQEELETTTSTAAQQLDEELDRQIEQVLTYGAQPETDPEHNSSRLLNQLVDETAFLGAELIAANGTVVDVQGQLDPAARDAAIGTDASDRPEVSRGLDGLPTVTAPNMTEETVMIAAPIWEADESEPQGVLVAAGRIDDLGVFEPLAPMETSIQSVRVEGETDNGSAAMIYPDHASFDEPLVGTAPLEETDWTVIVQRDQAAYTDQLQILQQFQIGSLIIVLVTVIGLGIYQYRTSLQQTEQLLTGFENLTAGNYDHRLSLSQAEEWQRIDAGFNEMITSIQERERLLSVLNRILRHNLQNDLTVIQGYAQMLPELDPEQQQTYIDEIVDMSAGLVSHGKKARQLQTILANAREPPVTVDIVELTGALCAEYQEEYPDTALETAFPAEPTYVEAVEGVKFGIDSLIENAFEHGNGDDLRVSVSIEPNEELVILTVADTGPGIPEHEYEILDQPEETALEHGSGIGLWLAHWAITESHGSLEFDTPAAGGTVVTVKLPRASTTQPPGEQ